MLALDDYAEPIKYFIDDQLFFELDSSKIKKANFFVQKSEASLEDDILQLGQSDDDTFYQVLNVRTYDDNYSDKDGYIVAVYIRSDKLYDSYARKVDDILTLLGDIGGLSEALFGFGMLLVGFLAQKMFMGKIVKKIYHMRKYENLDHEIERKRGSGTRDMMNTSIEH